MPLLSRLVLILAGSVGALYFAACIFLYRQQTRMIFFPSPSIEITPALLDLPHEEVWITVDQTERIHGWWIPAEDKEIGTLLYLHGNAINIGANVTHASRFHQIGFSVLLMDYRGYGLSEGNFPTEQQVYQDAEAMWNYLTQERNIPPEQIFVYGHSLGGAIAIQLATQQPNMAGLIIDGSFTRIRDMVNLNPLYRIFPIDWLLTQRFDSISKVSALQMPVLFIHGTADTKVPATMSELLYKAAPEPKHLYLVPEAGHNDVAEIAGLAYLQVVEQFVKQVTSPASMLKAP